MDGSDEAPKAWGLQRRVESVGTATGGAALEASLRAH
jgi:hypothetical protein